MKLTREVIESWKRHPEEVLSRSDAEWAELCDMAMRSLLYVPESKSAITAERLREMLRFWAHQGAHVSKTDDLAWVLMDGTFDLEALARQLNSEFISGGVEK